MAQIKNKFLFPMPATTIKGNNTGVTADPLDLTVAQVNAILPVFTSALNGLTPASGGGTSNFLRADGTWSAVATSGLSGDISLTTQVSGILPVSNGGTGDSSFSSNQVIIAGTTSTGALAQVAGGTSGYILTSTGTTSAPTWQASSSTSYAPTVQTFTSGSGTYTLPTSPRTPLYIEIEMVGGGGGGAGGAGLGTSGANGGTTTFGTSLLSAGGGMSGATPQGNSGGAGGTNTVNSPAITIINAPGNYGGSATIGPAQANSAPGGYGGSTIFAPGGNGIQSSGRCFGGNKFLGRSWWWCRWTH
jgi:hypothetical protein